jgi:prevent-host-death family protein
VISDAGFSFENHASNTPVRSSVSIRFSFIGSFANKRLSRSSHASRDFGITRGYAYDTCSRKRDLVACANTAMMYTFLYMKTSYSIAEARSELTGLVHEVERGKTVRITRRGKPAAVLLSEERFAELSNGRLTFSEAYRAWKSKGTSALPRAYFDAVRDRSLGRVVKV